LAAPPCPTLFPYTTLFRSMPGGAGRLRRWQEPGRRSGEEDATIRIMPPRHLEDDGLVCEFAPAALEEPLTDPVLRSVEGVVDPQDRKSTRLNSSHRTISYA